MDRFPLESWDPDRPDIAPLLAESALVDSGLIPSASNYVFVLALKSAEAGRGHAIYKPSRGEAPLWDFPPDLYLREQATYLLSEALGWGIVPPTVIREVGLEHGVGSVQLYIPHDRRCTFFDLRGRFPAEMRRFATFDWLSNNADRKGGHIILDGRNRLWAIDHGLTFHAEEKLRTVIWDYAEEPVPEPLLGDIEALLGQLDGGDLPERLGACLDRSEIEALRARAAMILREPRFPVPPSSRRPYPWPLV